MIRRPPRSTLDRSSAASDVYKRQAYGLQKEYAKSIDDISRCIALGRTDRLVYLQRARYYQGYGQFQNAINDLNQVILADAKDTEALQLRADCREANLDLEGALKDLEACLLYTSPSPRDRTRYRMPSSA